MAGKAKGTIKAPDVVSKLRIDTSAAEQDMRNFDQHLANTERNLNGFLTKLQKSNKSFEIDVGIDALKDAKKIWDKMKFELREHGESDIFKGLSESFDKANDVLKKMKVTVKGKEISGLVEAVETLTNADFGQISKIDFGLPDLKNNVLEAKKLEEATAKIAKNEEKAAKARKRSPKVASQEKQMDNQIEGLRRKLDNVAALSLAVEIDQNDLSKSIEELKKYEKVLSDCREQIEALNKLDLGGDQETVRSMAIVLQNSLDSVSSRLKNAQVLFAESQKIVERQINLQRKRNVTTGKAIPQTYVIPDTNYEIQKGTVGWNLYKQDQHGGLDLITTYETLNEIRKDSNLIAEQEAEILNKSADASQKAAEQAERQASAEKSISKSAQETAKAKLTQIKRQAYNYRRDTNNVSALAEREGILSGRLSEVEAIKTEFPALEKACASAEGAIAKTLGVLKNISGASEQWKFFETPSTQVSMFEGMADPIVEAVDAVDKLGDALKEVAQIENQISFDDIKNQLAVEKQITAEKEKQNDLVAIHGLSLENLKDAVSKGGFPSPSIAVTNPDAYAGGYGEATVVFKKSAIDPEANPANKVYGVDAYTATYPSFGYELNEEELVKASEKTGIAIEELRLACDRAHKNLAGAVGTVGFSSNVSEALQDLYMKNRGFVIETRDVDDDVQNSFHRDEELFNNTVRDFIKRENITFDAIVNDDKVRNEYVAELRKYADDFNKANVEAIESFPQFAIKESNISQIIDVLELARTNPKVYEDEKLSFEHDQAVIRGAMKVMDVADYNTKKFAFISENRSDYRKFVQDLISDILVKPNVRGYKGQRFDNTPEGIAAAISSYGGKNALYNEDAFLNSTMDTHEFIIAASRTYNNMEEITSDMARLQKDATGTHTSLQSKYSPNAIAGVIASENNMDIRDVWSKLLKAVDGNYTAESIGKALRDSGLTVDNATVSHIAELADESRTVPTRYFEGKPQRAVGIDEIEFVSLPTDFASTPEMKEMLTGLGIKVVEHISGDMESRAKALRDGMQKVSEVDSLPKLVDGVKAVESSAESAAAASQKLAQTNDEMAATASEAAHHVGYHAGAIGRLNKAETNGRFYGSNRGTGYYGTGYYFVDPAHKKELDQDHNYNKLPYTSIDLSQYTNLFKADTDEKASALHTFLKNLTRYTQDNDLNSLDGLFAEFQKVFGESVLTFDEFGDKVRELTDFMQNSSLDDRSDSVSTKFMKSLGYEGVDTSGTSYANTEYGIVVYELREAAVLQANITDEMQKQGDMLKKIDYAPGEVYDKDVDAKIQSRLDEQQRKKEYDAKVAAEFDKLYDGANYDKLLSDLNEVEQKLAHIDEQISAINDKPIELKKLAKDFNLGDMDDVIADIIEEEFDEKRLADLESERDELLKQKEELIARRDAEQPKIQAAYEQAQRNIEASAQAAVNEQEKLAQANNEVAVSANKAKQQIEEQASQQSVSAQKPLQISNLTSAEHQAVFGNGALDQLLDLFNIKGSTREDIIDQFTNAIKLFKTNIVSDNENDSMIASDMATEALHNITSAIINSGSIVAGFNTRLQDFYKTVNGVQIRYNDKLKDEFSSDWKSVRSRNSKILTSKSSGIGVDTLYEELLGEFSDLLSADVVNDADQLKAILGLMDQARDAKKNGYKILESLSNDYENDVYNNVVEIFGDASNILIDMIDAQQKLVAGEEELGEAVKNTNQARTNGTQEEVSAEELIERDLANAISMLRSAQDNETTLFSLKGVFSGEGLVEEARNFVDNIAEQANLKVGSFGVSDDLIKVQLYNDELKVTVDQTYRLQQATEETEAALELIGQSFKQNVKALNSNNFDVDGIRARATASVEKVRASLHGLSYDLSGLENAARNINSQDDFNKFNNQLKAAQDNIQAIRSSTVSKSSMNPLANMQRDMQNANIELDTMQLKLQKIGDVDGVKETEQTIKNMRQAVEQFNNATDAESQQSAYNEYSNLRSKFKAQLEYLNVAKTIDPSGPNNIEKYYKDLLDTVKKVNDLDVKINDFKLKDGGKGIYSGMISELESEKSVLLNKINQIGDDINTEFQGIFTSVDDSDKVKLPIGSLLDDTSSFSTVSDFLNDINVRAELTTEQIDKLMQALSKSSGIKFDFVEKFVSQFAQVEEAAKKLQDISDPSGNQILSKDSDAYKGALVRYAQYMQLRQSLDSDISKWSSEDIAAMQQSMKSFVDYSDAVTKAAEKEAKYFASKKQYEYSTSDELQGADKAEKNFDSAREALEKYVREFEDGKAVITGFTKSADGISKIDFGWLDESTGQFRTFYAEVGQFSDKIHDYETSMKNLTAGTDAVKKSLANLSALNTKLSGIEGTEGQIRQIMQLMSSLRAELDAVGDSNDAGSQAKLKNLAAEADKVFKSVSKMVGAFENVQGAIDGIEVKELGKIDLNGDKRAQIYQLIKNSADDASISNVKFSDSLEDVTYTMTTADGKVVEMTAHLHTLNGAVIAQQKGVGQLKTWWQDLGSGLGGIGKEVLRYGANMLQVMDIIRYLRQGFNAVKEIDAALTELKKVTDETEASYNKFLQTASQTAGKIGSTVSDFTEATANFARLGYDMDTSADMAKTAIVYKNVADGIDNVEESTDSIISTMKAFGIESDNTMSIVDKFNAVGNAFAITSAGIGEAFQRSASALYEGGNTIDESIALVTAANSV